MVTIWRLRANKRFDTETLVTAEKVVEEGRREVELDNQSKNDQVDSNDKSEVPVATPMERKDGFLVSLGKLSKKTKTL